MTLLTDPDGSVHFSTLKQMAKSPAHYAYRCKNPMEMTRDMRIGVAVHHRVLGQNNRHHVYVFEGDTRRGKAWDAYAEAHKGHVILTMPEALEAEPIADAVDNDPVARTILNGTRREVPLTWTDNGIPCATTGIDIVGPDYIADLKVVHNAEPEYLQKHALRMAWHAQVVWYRDGLIAQEAKGSIDMLEMVDMTLHLLCVESSPPHCVTVLTLSPEVIEAGQKCVRAWIERLKVCAESDSYPGYVQSPVTWALPEWMTDQEFDE